MAYTLPELPYAYDALEPFIDAKTMEIHHTKHHQAYIDNLNKALDNDSSKSIEELLISDTRAVIQNHGGGHYNHSLFWKMMKPNGGGSPKGELLAAIEKTFGSFEDFKKEFTTKALTQFGSGWAWLVKDKENKISIIQKLNQNHPDLATHTPILGVDVWEHAYYLKYQNKRADYIVNFWNVVNWPFCEALYSSK